jgi:hypothetical protein
MSHQLFTGAGVAQHSAAFVPIGLRNAPTAEKSGRRLASRRAGRTRAGAGGTQASKARSTVPPCTTPRLARFRRIPQGLPPKGCGGMPRLLCCRSLAMEGHRHRRGASSPDPWRTQRTTPGNPAEPLGRKHLISLQLSGLATKAGQICELASCIFHVIGVAVRTPDHEEPASVDFAHPSPIMRYWTLRSTER